MSWCPVVFFIYCFIGAFASGDQIIAMVPVGLMFAKKLRLDPIIGMSIVILAYFVGGLSSPTGAMLPQLTMGLELYSGFFVRFVIFLVLSTVAMLFVLRYAKRVAKDPRNSVMDPADWLDQEPPVPRIPSRLWNSAAVRQSLLCSSCCSPSSA